MVYNQSMSDKPKTTACFRLMPSGEVVGEIVGDQGKIVVKKSFGKFTTEEFDLLLDAMKAENPETDIMDISLSSN